MKYFLLSTILLGSFYSKGQDIHFDPLLAAISVRNLDSASVWYNRCLGFEIVNVKDFPDYGMRIGMLKKDRFQLELVELKNSVAPSSLLKEYRDNPAKIQGIGKLTFTVNDIEKLFSQLKKQRARFLFELQDDVPGKRKWFIVGDADGNWLQFVKNWE